MDIRYVTARIWSTGYMHLHMGWMQLEEVADMVTELLWKEIPDIYPWLQMSHVVRLQISRYRVVPRPLS